MASFGKTTFEWNGLRLQDLGNGVGYSPRRDPLPTLAPNRALEDTMRCGLARRALHARFIR
jgi:hypothetical protein